MHVNDYNETFQIKHLHLFRQKFSVILIYQKIKESKLFKDFWKRTLRVCNIKL